MSDPIISVKGVEQWCNTTANTYGGLSLVRVLNINTSSAFLLTIVAGNNNPNFANGVNVGTVSIGPTSQIFIRKWWNDTVASNSAANNVLAVPVGYEN